MDCTCIRKVEGSVLAHPIVDPLCPTDGTKPVVRMRFVDRMLGRWRRFRRACNAFDQRHPKVAGYVATAVILCLTLAWALTIWTFLDRPA